MKIYIDEIPPDGLRQRQTLNIELLELESEDMHFIKPPEVELFAKKIRDEVMVTIDITAKIQTPCARCLESFIYDIHREIERTYNVQGKTEINLTPDIREELILNYPVKSLCQPDCKGLCPICGQNRNHNKCGHSSVNVNFRSKF